MVPYELLLVLTDTMKGKMILYGIRELILQHDNQNPTNQSKTLRDLNQ